MPDTILDLPAPAKLNLFLHVTGRRADGYHLLETIFELIDLEDQIRLRPLPNGQIERETVVPGVEPEDDLTVRAARLLAQETGCREGVAIGVTKRIPMGGGLGGGSSDAASVLMGLNRMWRLGLSRAALAAIGLRLGADVPFFIFGQTAYATGVGEVFEACEQPPRAYLMVAPGVGVPTPRVFSDPGLTRDTKPLKIFGLLQRESSGASPGANQLDSAETSLHDRGGTRRGHRGGAGRILSQQVNQHVLARGRNDLQAVVERLYPEVGQALSAMSATAQALGVGIGPPRMSGSGSTLFLPMLESQLDAAVRHLRADARLPTGAQVFTARSVARHPLCDWAFA